MFYGYNCGLSLNVMILIIRITYCQRYHHQFINQGILKNNGTRVFSNGRIGVISPPQNMLVEQQRKIQNVITAPVAENRYGYYRRDILNRKRKKIKCFKRELKKCGHILRQNLKFIKKSDDGAKYDTIRIKISNDIPYGYQDEYFPRRLKEFRNETNTGYYEKLYKPSYDDGDEDGESQIFKNRVNLNLDKKYQTRSSLRPETNQTLDNTTFYGLVRQPIYNTRFIRMESTPRQFSNSRQSVMVPIQPWMNSTLWTVSRQGVLPIPYQLKEPIPGVLEVTPPSILIKKNLKYIDIKKAQEVNTNIYPISGNKDNSQVKIRNISPFTSGHTSPYYSIYGAYSDIKSNTLKVGNTDISTDKTNSISENFVNITPRSNSINKNKDMAKEINRNSKDKLKLNGNVNYTHHDQFKNEQHFVKNYVGSKSNWMPVIVKYPDENGNDKLSMGDHTFNYVATLPLPNQQQVHSVIRNTYSEDETRQMVTPATKQLEIITAKYPLEDKNNIPDSTKQNKPTSLITKENMRQFYPNRTLIFFNVVDNKKSNTKNTEYKDLNKIPSVNSNGKSSSRLNNISVLVSGSMLVNEN